MNLWSYLTDSANWPGPDGITHRLLEHLGYTVSSVGIATVIAVVIGVLVGHTRKGNLVVVGVTNAARAVPTLGLLVLVVTVLGTGLAPVILALTVLAIPPVLNATATGVREADPQAVLAAKALGMTPAQVIFTVELPLAFGLIISGIRSATLQVVSTATVAALAAAGGLGRLVIDGQRVGAQGYPEMFAGAILVAGLAVVLDVLLGGISWAQRALGRSGAARDSRDTKPAEPAANESSEPATAAPAA